MKKVLYVVLAAACLISAYTIRKTFFSSSNELYERMPQVKEGMTQQEVMRILATPDLLYVEYPEPRSASKWPPYRMLAKPELQYRWSPANDSTLVMQYHMGFMAPDDLRVYLQQDSVVAVVYNP
ncbi:hypothetical protein [Hymenobacter latericus]|uniref:hypothetical protein n=1 Tax=Hymenobacter sp. YIM 151858-1 TaxID=2987688 RepID=UPI0022268464|nr:hypothetical protein [Hymenobacter sp. YIM 151858-1]UYZ58936.1 hypothetical protein OIS50_17985 [Hymenobacter sp. YIM 151858-1]